MASRSSQAQSNTSQRNIQYRHNAILKSFWFNFSVGLANIISGAFAIIAYFSGPTITANNIPTAQGTGDIITAFRVMLIVTFFAVVLLSLQALVSVFSPVETRRATSVEKLFDEVDYYYWLTKEVKFLMLGIKVLAGAHIAIVIGLAGRIVLRFFTGI